MNFEALYEEMKRAKLVDSAYEFSETYLGKSPNYYSVLKCRNLEPSIGAVINLEMALREQLDTKSQEVAVENYAELGSLLKLSRSVRCYRETICGGARASTNREVAAI